MAVKTNRIKINQYNQLINEKSLFNAFLRSDSFETSNITELEKQLLKQINAIEVEIKRESISLLEVDEIFEITYLIISDFILKSNKSTYAIITEHMPKLVTKLRSYKGIFDLKFKNDPAILQIEHLIENNYSIIIGIVKLSKNNINTYLKNYFNDATNCCFISSNTNSIFSESFLNDFSIDCMKHNSTSTIDYCRLSLKIMEFGNIVRLAGDGGNTCISFQTFQNIKYSNEIFKEIQKSIISVGDFENN
jgi:hypothetical protein